MYTYKLTVKNYRCFSDERPLHVEFGHGFTGLIGINNSGKSSFLRLFYELRYVFNALLGDFKLLFDERGMGAGLGNIGIGDPTEIYHRYNQRDISIDIEISNVRPHGNPLRVNRLLLLAKRQQPDVFKAVSFVGDVQVKLEGSSLDNTQTKIQNSLGTCDYSDMLSAIRDLSDSFYVPPFRNAINKGSGSYYDLNVGSTFIDTWHGWRTSGNRNQYDQIDQITSDIMRIFGYQRLEINAAKERQTLVIAVDGKSFDLHELGAGLAQFIILFGGVAMRKPPFILIDEPELNLHPALQLDFVTALTSYATRGMVFATHSVGLARSVASRIYSFQKPERHSIVAAFEQSPNYVELLGELSYSTHKEVGYDKVLLVEGVHDITTVQQLLRLYGKAHKVVLVPLGGSVMIRGDRHQQLEELRRLASHVEVLIDSERTAADQQLTTERAAFVAACTGLNIPIHVLERRAIENYFPERAIKATLGSNFGVLGHYERLSESVMPWSKQDNWRIAQKITPAELAGTDIGVFLDTL